MDVMAPSDIVERKPQRSPPIPPPLQGGVADARAVLQKVVGQVGPSLGNVFLVPHPWIGMILWLALASDPRLAAFGLLGLGIAMAGQRALGIKEEALVDGGLKANALLSAIAAGWMTAPTLYPLHAQIGIAVAASVCAFVITAAIARVLRTTECPSLLWAYCLTTGTMFALFPVAAMLASQQWTWWHIAPDSAIAWLAAFFRSIGSLLFAPSVEAGALVVCAILLWSRAAFAAGMVGWMAGAALAVSLQSLGVTYYWLPASYNYFVAGMAIGAFFVLPACSSLPFAALAGTLASIFGAGLQSLFPVFAYLPTASALAIWTGLGALGLAGVRCGFWRNCSPFASPEEAWWRDMSWAQRLGRAEPLLVVPIAGVVEVAEGFNGPLSHSKEFQHALDFVRVAPPGSPTTDTDPPVAESIWNTPVTAPAAGYVERVRDGIADNPLGVCNFSESWGNYVCMRLDQGGWALLAHFRRGSIVAQPGMRVEIGTYLGAVGNSGRSPFPHLHLQAQEGPEPGAATVPFRLANFQSGRTADQPLDEWNAAKVPKERTMVMMATPNPAVHSMLASLAPGAAIWTVEQRGTVPRSFRERRTYGSLQVGLRLDASGRHIFSCNGSSLISVLAPDAWRVLEQRGTAPFLRLLAHAAPSIPYAAQPRMFWSDMVADMPPGRPQWLALLLAPYRMQPFTYAQPMCVRAPTPEGGLLKIETLLASQRQSLPSKIAVSFDKVRGPASIEATFDHGSLHYCLVSFAPGLPL